MLAVTVTALVVAAMVAVERAKRQVAEDVGEVLEAVVGAGVEAVTTMADVAEAVTVVGTAATTIGTDVAEAATVVGAALTTPGTAQVQPSTAAARDPVIEEFGTAVATVMSGWFREADFDLEPTESGFGLQFTHDGSVSSWSIDFTSVNELLDKVARGESVVAGAGRLDGDHVIPDWVPVYPGARRNSSLVVGREGFIFGFTAFVAEDGGHRILDWYDRTATRMARAGTSFQHRVTLGERARGLNLRRDLGRYHIRWDDRQITVFVVEDDHGNSAFLLLYHARGEGAWGRNP